MLAPLVEWIPFAGWEPGSSAGSFTLLLVLHTLVGLAIANRVLFGPWSRPRERITARHVVLAIAAVVLAAFLEYWFLGRFFPWRRAGLSRFAVGAFAWHDAIYVAPACAIRALVRARRGTALAPAVIAALCLVFSGVAVAGFAHLVEPYRLEVEAVRVPLARARAGAAPLRVAVIADLQTDHVTAFERSVIDEVVAARPDLIVIPGDVFQSRRDVFEREREAMREQLARLDAPGGVYLVRGDVDSDETLAGLIGGTKIRRLADEWVRVRVKDRSLTIAGIDDWLGADRARACVAELEREAGADDVRILIAHHPDVVYRLQRNTRVDLLIAGHTHGGQVVVPGYGPPITLSAVPRDVAAGGLHALDGRRLFVSRGIGMERLQAPRVRFCCRPHLPLLDLVSDDDAADSSR